MIEYPIVEEKGFKYLDSGIKGEETPLLLLHGLFGTASNFGQLISHFGPKRRVILPILPIFEMPLRKLSVNGLVQWIEEFIKEMKYDELYVLGNSLGGHLALLLTLRKSLNIKALILTASSGLYESAFGSSIPKREDYDYIRQKIELTFYDKEVVTKEMVDEIFALVNNRLSALRIVKTAKSAIRQNVGEELHEIKIPTLLVWGKQDTITPPEVGTKFDEYLENSELHFLDKCGHAPMMERANEFNEILENFLSKMDNSN